jgi:hypothetical protein
MDELVKLVAKRVGIPEAQAKQAVETVVGFLKEKLPAPLAGQIDSAIGDSGAVKKGVEGLAKGLGGVLGGKK